MWPTTIKLRRCTSSGHISSPRSLEPSTSTTWARIGFVFVLLQLANNLKADEVGVAEVVGRYDS